MSTPRPWSAPVDLAAVIERLASVADVTTFCHVPGDAPIDLPALAHGGDALDRWSAADRPTVYLATDPGVVLAELGRHETGAREVAVDRRVLRLDLAGVRLLDLRDRAVVAALGIEGAPHVFLDRALARAVGEAVRATDACEGIRVPSMALLDKPERHCVVLFGDRIPGGFVTRVASCREAGDVRFAPDGLWAGRSGSPRAVLRRPALELLEESGPEPLAASELPDPGEVKRAHRAVAMDEPTAAPLDRPDERMVAIGAPEGDWRAERVTASGVVHTERHRAGLGSRALTAGVPAQRFRTAAYGSVDHSRSLARSSAIAVLCTTNSRRHAGLRASSGARVRYRFGDPDA